MDKLNKNKLIEVCTLILLATLTPLFLINTENKIIGFVTLEQQQMFANQTFDEKAITINTTNIMTITTNTNSLLINIFVLVVIILLIYLGIQHYKIKHASFVNSTQFLVATKWTRHKLKTNSKEKILLALLESGLNEEQIKLVLNASKIIQKNKKK